MAVATMQVTRKQKVDILDLAQKIKQAREAKGLSILGLHEISGISRVSLTKFENGEAKSIAYHTVKKLEKFLDVDFGVKFNSAE